MANIQAKNVMSKPSMKIKDGSNNADRVPDSYVMQLTVQQLMEELPRLARGGQMVNALKGIQGHSRFLWFYQLLDKVGRKYFCEKEKEQTEVKKEIRAELPVLKKAAEKGR